jgi:hypothetical protein
MVYSGGVSVLPSVECKQPWKTKGVDGEYLTIAKVWENKLKYLHPIQRKIAEKAINEAIRSGYGNFAQMVRVNQLPASKLGFVESRDVGSFTYP